MGGAQPLAVTLNGGVCLVVDVARVAAAAAGGDALPRRAGRSTWTTPSSGASRRRRAGEAVSVGLVGNCAVGAARAAAPRASRSTSSPTRPRRTTRWPTCPTASTSTTGTTTPRTKPEEFTDRARESMARHVEAMVGFLDGGAEVFDYGNSIRDEARQGGYDRAFAFPGFVPGLHPAAVLRRARGRSGGRRCPGDPADIAATDEAVLELFPDDDKLQRWIRAAREKVAFQGLPARICWLGHGERDRAGLRFNELVASGAVAAPIVIGRDHLDAGSVASPYRETEAMADGSDAIADWPLLNALVNTASGATWVSIHHGGGVGIGPVDPRRAGDAWRTARRWRRRSSRGCWRTTRRWACCGTSTRATRGAGGRGAGGLRVPMRRGRGSTRARAARSRRRHLPDDRATLRRGCGPTSRGRRARIPAPAATGGSPGPARTPTCGSGSPGEAAARGLDVVDDRAGNLWAWWGDPDADDAARRRPRLAPGLRARRRRLRRPARRGLGARRASTRCARRGFTPGPPARRRAVRRRGGRPVRRRLRRVAAAHRSARPPTAPAGCADARRRQHGRGARRGPGATRPRSGRDDGGAAPGRRRSSSCTSSRAGRWPTLGPRRRRRHRHLAARPLAHRPAGRGQPRRAPPRSPTGATRCSPSPPSSSPPAAPPRWHDAAGDLRQGRGRAERGQRDPVAGHGLARRPGAAARTPCGPSSRRWRAWSQVHGGTVTEESWTDRDRRSTPASRRGSPRCSARRRAACWRPAPGTTRASSPRRVSRRRCCSSATRPGISHSPGRARRARRLPGRGRRARATVLRRAGGPADA